jgi:hypothetical protein
MAFVCLTGLGGITGGFGQSAITMIVLLIVCCILSTPHLQEALDDGLLEMPFCDLGGDTGI